MGAVGARLRAALRESGVSEHVLVGLGEQLATARSLRAQGQLGGAAARLLSAHEEARNLPLVHARIHLSLARLRWLQGERGEALRELERATLAPVASGLRRLGGRRPEEPVEGGLWASALRAAAVAAGRQGR